MGQKVAVAPVAGSSGGQWVTKPRPPACYVEQEVATAERGRSAATSCVQRVVAGVPRASTAGPHAGKRAAHDGPGLEGPLCDTTTLETSTREKQSSAAEMLKQARLQRLELEAISEEESKVLEERIEEEQREAAKASAIASAVAASMASTAAAAEMGFPKDGLITSGGLRLFPSVPGQESLPPYRSKSRSGSFVTAGSSSEAARRSPEAASEVGEASRIAAEVEERWRAVKLVEEQLATREAALRSAEQAQAQAAGQPVAVPSSIHIPPHEERLQVVAAQATELAGVSRPGLWQAGYKRLLDIHKWPCHVF